MVASDARLARFCLALARIGSGAMGLAGAACAFDERTLHEAPLGGGGEGGEPSSPLNASSGAGATASSAGGLGTRGDFGSNGGSGGSGGATSITSAGTPLPPGTNIECPDLDRNSVDDCEETLAENAGFEASAESWQAQEPVELDWQDAGSSGGETGSVAVMLAGVSDKRSMEGAYQCLEVEAGSSYLVYAQALIRDEQGSAAVSMLFYDTSDCSGARIGEATSNMLSASERWRVVHLQAGAPTGAESMRVRLVAVKEPAVERIEVRFDNVLVRQL